MATAKELAKAFKILAEYSEENYILDAEYEEIKVWVDPDKVSEEDKKALDDIGFHSKPNGEFEPHFYYFT
jgi:hypothetical protein